MNLKLNKDEFLNNVRCEVESSVEQTILADCRQYYDAQMSDRFRYLLSNAIAAGVATAMETLIKSQYTDDDFEKDIDLKQQYNKWMPLSNKDLTDIAKEFAIAKADMISDKAVIPKLEEELDKKNDQADRMYIMYNNAHVERATPYEVERRWLDGTTYSTILKSQIETFGPTTGKADYFYPVSWTKSNAQLTPNGTGNPTGSDSNSEKTLLQNTLENNGLIVLTNFLLNGQASAATNRTLSVPYSPGDNVITFGVTHDFTVGRYLYISGSGTSAMVRITGSTMFAVNIAEIIQPAGTIMPGSTVVENIVGFSNIERQNLTSTSYQNILNQLTTRISATAALYATALDNQLAQLNINIDSPIDVAAAKNSVETAKTAYSTWLSLSPTGVGGRWTNAGINPFISSYMVRNGGFATREAQITTALGSITQNAEGDYSGVGVYLQRFKCLNFLINTANGPLYQANGLRIAIANYEQKVANNADKLATYSNLVRYAEMTRDPSGNSSEFDGAYYFSPGDAVLLCGNDLPGVECTVTAISSDQITLSIAIPEAYNKEAKGSIIKRV